MMRKDYRKLRLTLYFPSWSSGKGFSNSVDRSIATYTIELPTALMIAYALPALFKILFPLVRGVLLFPQVGNYQLSLVCEQQLTVN